jgi:ribonuclease HI
MESVWAYTHSKAVTKIMQAQWQQLNDIERLKGRTPHDDDIIDSLDTVYHGFCNSNG